MSRVVYVLYKDGKPYGEYSRLLTAKGSKTLAARYVRNSCSRWVIVKKVFQLVSQEEVFVYE
jgi:hypothetical protein